MASKRTKYFRTIDIVKKYGCTRSDVTQAIVDGILKAHKRSNKWYVLMEQPEAFAEFGKRIASKKPRITQKVEPAPEPEVKETTPTIPKLVFVPVERLVKKKSISQPRFAAKALERPIGVQYLADKDISETLLPEIENAKQSIKIATSNFKNLFIDGESIFSVFERKVNQGVKIQILCMSINDPAIEELNSHLMLQNNKLFVIKVCPRNHMKMFSFDWNIVYVGSANLTNAAMGSRTKAHMNFENGIITDDRKIVTEVIGHFDRVWIASACEGCKSKICVKNQ